jgi:multiple sugar transport system permease protein
METAKLTLVDRFANKKKYLAYLFLLPAIVILFGIAIFPLIFSLSASLTNFTYGMPKIKFIGFTNYADLFQDDYFWNGLKLTGLFAGGTTLGSLFIGFLIALLFDFIDRGRGIVRAIVLSPMCITSVSVGIMWRLLFMPDFSIINYLLSLLNISGPEWLFNPAWALIAVMIAYIWQWTPFIILMISAGMAALPIEPYEAAMVDGATWFQTIRYITIPLIRPVILLAAIIRLMDAFRVFDHVFVMTHGGPGRSTQVLSYVIYLNGIRYRYLGYATAMSWIMLIIIIVLATLMIRVFREARF